MKKILLYFVALAGCLMLPACTGDILSQEPTDALSKDNYWKTEDDAVSALAGVTSDTRYLFDRDYYLDGMSEFVKMRGNSFMANNGNNGRAYMGRWDYLPWGYGGYFENMFKYCYGAINHANYTIANVEEMIEKSNRADEKKNLETIVAECKLLRALVYFRLITWWGDVPYIDWNVKSNAEVESLSRTPIAEIYAHLIDDLNDVVLKLPEKSEIQGRFSKPAAIALRGKIHLYWASWNHFGWPELDTFTPDEAEARKAYQLAKNDFGSVIHDFGLDLFRGGEPGECDGPAEMWPEGTVVNGVDISGKVKKFGGADKLPNYYYLFLPTANGDSEFVFAFEHGGGSGSGQGEQYMRDFAGRTVQYSQSWVNPRYCIADRYQSTETGDFLPPMVTMSPSTKAVNTPNCSLNPQSYANRDYRMKASIMWNYEQLMGMMSLKETGLTQYEYKNWEGPISQFEIDEEGNLVENKFISYNVLSTTGYVFRKFVRNYAGEDRAEGAFNWPVIRLADVFLMYAEADNELNGPTAESIELVNRIRHRGNLPPLKADKCKDHDSFFEAIEQERIVELLAEGHRTWDLRRWRRLEHVYGGVGATGHKWFDVFGALENEYWVNSPALHYEQCYIFQIPESERNRNPNMTQNKPWR